MAWSRPAALTLLVASTAWAQAPVRLNPGQDYQGVVPGQPNRPPAARRASRAPVPVVTWPGFQMTPTGSRIFVQTSASVPIDPSAEPGKLVYALHNCRIDLRNNRNPLVTEHFNTPVVRAYLRQRGRDVQLVLEMRAQVSPSVRQEAAGVNGFQYIFLEFPAGRYFVEPEPAPDAAPTVPLSAGPEPPPFGPSGLDTEMPPSQRRSPAP